MDGSRPITHVNTMWVPFKYYTFVHICHSYTASMSTCCETYTHYCPTHNRSTPLTQRRMVGLKLYKELFIFLQARMEPHRIMNSYHWNEKSRFFEWTAKQHLWTCRFRSFASFFCFFFFFFLSDLQLLPHAGAQRQNQLCVDSSPRPVFNVMALK